MIVLLWHWLFVMAACGLVFTVGHLRRRGTALSALKPVPAGVVVTPLTRPVSEVADGRASLRIRTFPRRPRRCARDGRPGTTASSTHVSAAPQ